MNKTLKRVLSIIIVFTLLIPANLAFASSYDPTKVLEQLGIAEEVMFPYFHLNYTRMEFAKMLCKLDPEYLPGIGDTKAASDLVQSPVNPSYWTLWNGSGSDTTSAYGDVGAAGEHYVAYVVEKKYMFLDGSGNFKPNDKVTYNDAIVALVTLLDYDRVAVANGGKIADYVNAAKRIGITKGVNSSNEFISKEDLATMILNSLEILPAEVSYDGAVMAQPTILESKNLITGEAKLLSTDSWSVGAPVCDEGYVNLGGKIYKAESDFDDSMVGSLVQYYIRDNGGKQTVVSLANIGGESITLTPNDIYDIRFGKTQLEFSYGDDETIRLPYTATFSVNGNPGDLTEEIFEVFDSGELRVIDSDGNGGFDTVDMTVCVTEVVDSASAEGMNINTQYTKKHLDLNANNNPVVVFEGGKEVSMASVRNGSVVSVACDAYTISGGKIVFDYDKATIVRVYVSNRKVTGMLESISDRYYTVEGRSYKTHPKLSELESGGTKNKLDAGNEYMFRLDYFGNLCDYELTAGSSEMEYGYLMDGGEISNGFTGNAQVRILTLKNEFVTYDMRDKYIVDGERYVIGEDAFPARLKDRQLIKYRLVDGKVAEIDTPTVSSEEVPETSLSMDGERASRRFSSNQRGFLDYKIMTTGNTKVFIANEDTKADDVNYTVTTTAEFQSMTDYNIEGYDIGDMGDTGCIVMYTPSVSTAIDRFARSYMVEKIAKAVNEAGDDVYRLVVHGYGGSQTLDTVERTQLVYSDKSGSKNTSIDDIDKGDVVRIVQDNVKRIVNMERVFCLAEEPDFFDPYYDAAQQSGIGHYGYGQLYQTNNTHFEFTAVEDIQNITPEDRHVFSYYFPKQVAVYNMQDNTMTTYSNNFQENIPTYLSSADRVTVFLQMNIYELMSIMVYIWE